MAEVCARNMERHKATGSRAEHGQAGYCASTAIASVFPPRELETPPAVGAPANAAGSTTKFKRPQPTAAAAKEQLMK